MLTVTALLIYIFIDRLQSELGGVKIISSLQIVNSQMHIQHLCIQYCLGNKRESRGQEKSRLPSRSLYFSREGRHTNQQIQKINGSKNYEKKTKLGKRDKNDKAAPLRKAFRRRRCLSRDQIEKIK